MKPIGNDIELRGGGSPFRGQGASEGNFTTIFPSVISSLIEGGFMKSDFDKLNLTEGLENGNG
jgi:hypothetical protein